MARINPDLMQLDDGATGAPRVAGPRTDTSQVSEADINAAVAKAGEELGVDSTTLAYEAGLTGASVRVNKFSPQELAAYQQGRSDKATQTRKFGTPDNPQPYAPPPGANWNLYGGVWKLYYKGAYIGDESGFDQNIINTMNARSSGNNGNNGNNGNGGNNGDGGDNIADTTTTLDTTGKPTTNIDVLKAALRSLGFTSAILDSSTSFLNSLLKEGLDYDNATEVFLNSKEYTLKSGTKITSPFYTEYGYLNEGLVVPKSASEIFNAVEGYKEVVDKYALSKKYLEKDSLKNYVKNNVTVAELAERANIATLKSVNQDPAYVEALQKLGYIATAADLKDFFLDPKIGKEQLELNRNTGAFAAEAIRRAKSGIQFNAERLKSLASTLTEKGFSEEKVSALAAEGFENIAAQLGTTTKLSGIYETQRQATMGQVQSELESEQFGGLASERRKRLTEQEVRAFQGSAGTTSSSLRQANVLGII